MINDRSGVLGGSTTQPGTNAQKMAMFLIVINQEPMIVASYDLCYLLLPFHAFLDVEAALKCPKLKLSLSF